LVDEDPSSASLAVSDRRGAARVAIVASPAQCSMTAAQLRTALGEPLPIYAGCGLRVARWRHRGATVSFEGDALRRC
jgi:hypothetical protein